MTTLAPVLSQIQEALATQGETRTTWTADALIVLKRIEKGAEIANIRADRSEEILSFEDIQVLASAGLLVDDGALQTVRAGSKRIKVLGIKLTELRQAVMKENLEASRVAVLQSRVKSTERALKQAQDQNATDQAVAALIHDFRTSLGLKAAANFGKAIKFNRTKPRQGQALAGVPTLMLSDWHWGETVHPEQIQYLNEFNLDIARKRADRVFTTALELLFHHQAGQSYDGYTMCMAGDMFSGNIHEELRQTNGLPILEAVMELAQVLVGNIIEASRNFEWVYVPCVVGNHGRIDRKPTAKFAVKDNFDWQLYQIVAGFVQARLGDKCNVRFDISESLDLRYNLYGTRYLMTHGDQIQGGSGIGGFWPSMMKTAMKKQSRLVAAGDSGFDYMLCGHFHKYGAVSNVIVNGSLKGYDEWVYKMNFEHEPPIQALWTTHPDYGIIDRRPIYAEALSSDNTSKAQAVTTFKQGVIR